MDTEVQERERLAVARLVAEIGSEKYTVERIRAELASRRWSQAELSRRMEEAVAEGRNGGVIHQGVLSKLLAGDRGRHIGIDQLLTLSKVFSIPMGELLLPPEELANVRGWRYYLEALDIVQEIRELELRKWERLQDLRPMLDQSVTLAQRIREWAADTLRRHTAHLTEVIERDAGGSVGEEDLQRQLREFGLYEVPVIALARELLGEEVP